MLSIRSPVFEEARRFSQHERPVLSPFSTLLSAKLSSSAKQPLEKYDMNTMGRPVCTSTDMQRDPVHQTSKQRHLDVNHVAEETHGRENGPGPNSILTGFDEDEPPSKKYKMSPYPEDSKWPWLPPLLAAEKSDEVSPLTSCGGCKQTIAEPSYLSVGTTPWHLQCLFCDVCGQNLQWEKTCYIHSGRVFCRKHYESMLHCQRCGEKFNELDSIHRFAQGVCYHRSCLVCIICSRHLTSGDAFTVYNGDIYCVAHRIPDGTKQTICWRYALPPDPSTTMTTDANPFLNTGTSWSADDSWKLSNDWLRLFASPHSTSTPQKPDCTANTEDNHSRIAGLARLLANSDDKLPPVDCRETNFHTGFHETPPPPTTELHSDREANRKLPGIMNLKLPPTIEFPSVENQQFSPPFDRIEPYSPCLNAVSLNNTMNHELPSTSAHYNTRSTTVTMSYEPKETQMRKQRSTMKQPMKHAKDVLEKSKRIRTSFKHDQIHTMKLFFDKNQNPDSKDLKELSIATGLSKRVLQVWFQNARAKYRRSMLSPTYPGQTGQGLSIHSSQDQQFAQSLSSISDIFSRKAASPPLTETPKSLQLSPVEQPPWMFNETIRAMHSDNQTKTPVSGTVFTAPVPIPSQFPGFSTQESVTSSWSQNSALSTSFDSTSTPSPISQLYPVDELGDFCPFLLELGTNEERPDPFFHYPVLQPKHV